MDNYVLGEELTDGGFAFLITRKSDRKQLVAKQVCLADMTPKQKLKAFDEANGLAQIRHPNICTFIEFFQERLRGQDYLYIISEYCAGGSLQSRIAEQQDEPFPTDQIKEWLRSLCLALAYVHSRGEIHHNLKPQNIFLTELGVVKLGDFGIAVVAAAAAAAGTTNADTMSHLAPEVLDAYGNEAETYDYRCDLWSLGVVLYELITLTPPFQARSLAALVTKICAGKYEPISLRAPRDLRDLVVELLDMDPPKRPDCTEILSRDLLKQRQPLPLRQLVRSAEVQRQDHRPSTPEPTKRRSEIASWRDAPVVLVPPPYSEHASPLPLPVRREVKIKKRTGAEYENSVAGADKWRDKHNLTSKKYTAIEIGELRYVKDLYERVPDFFYHYIETRLKLQTWQEMAEFEEALKDPLL